MTITEMLALVPLFGTLSEEQLESLAHHVRRRIYRVNEAVFHKDEPGQTLYIINAGRIKIHNITDDGHEVILALLPAGDFFGEMSLLDGSGRSADATALEPSELLMLHREDFLQCLQQFPKMVSHILAVLGARIRHANAQLDSFSSLNINGRVARQLVLLSQQHGVKTRSGIKIEPRLTQQNLASLIGATRESVNKTMRYLCQNRYVSVERQHITILNPDALKRLYTV